MARLPPQTVAWGSFCAHRRVGSGRHRRGERRLPPSGHQPRNHRQTLAGSSSLAAAQTRRRAARCARARWRRGGWDGGGTGGLQGGRAGEEAVDGKAGRAGGWGEKSQGRHVAAAAATAAATAAAARAARCRVRASVVRAVVHRRPPLRPRRSSGERNGARRAAYPSRWCTLPHLYRSEQTLQRRPQVIFAKRGAMWRQRVSILREWGRNAPASTSPTPFTFRFNQIKCRKYNA